MKQALANYHYLLKHPVSEVIRKGIDALETRPMEGISGNFAHVVSNADAKKIVGALPDQYSIGGLESAGVLEHGRDFILNNSRAPVFTRSGLHKLTRISTRYPILHNWHRFTVPEIRRYVPDDDCLTSLWNPDRERPNFLFFPSGAYCIPRLKDDVIASAKLIANLELAGFVPFEKAFSSANSMHIISLGKSDFNEWLGKSGGKFRASEHPDASKLRGGLAALLKNNGILEDEAAARVAQALGGFVDYKAALAAYREEKGLGKKDEEKTPEPELALERDSSNFERVDEPQPNVAMRRADKILFQHLAPLFDLDIYSHFGWNAPQVSPALLSHLPLSSIFLDLASANRIHAALRNALYAERERQKSSSRNQLRKKVEVLVTQSYSTFGSDTALSGLDDEQLDSLSELVFSSIHVGEGKTLVHGRSLGVPPVSLPHIQQFQSQLSLPEGNEREALEKLVYALDALHIQHESMINSSSLAMNNLLHNPHKIFEGLVGGKPYSFSSSEAFAAYSVLNNMLATRRNFISDLRNAMDHSRSQISR